MKSNYIESDEEWIDALFVQKKEKIIKYQKENQVYSNELDWIVREVPAALVYNGIAYTVMMILPQDIEYFVIGFSVSEGIVDKSSQIRDIEITTTDLGLLLEIEIPSRMEMRLKAKKKTMAGRTGCGLCGSAFLEQIFLKLPILPNSQVFFPQSLELTLKELSVFQPIGQDTGCTHIAAWIMPSGKIMAAFEDVGRHIALDKILGYCLQHKLQQGALLLSSRASYEMVQKSVRCGVEIIFALSAVTSLAIETAKKANLTLVGFVKNRQISVYSGKQRIKL